MSFLAKNKVFDPFLNFFLLASGVPHSVMVSKYLGDLQQKVNEIEGNINTKYAEEAQSIRNLIGEKNNDCNHQINEFRLHS